MEAVREKHQTKSRKKRAKHKDADGKNDEAKTKEPETLTSIVDELKPPEITQSLKEFEGEASNTKADSISEVTLVSELASDLNLDDATEQDDAEITAEVQISNEKLVESAPPCEDTETIKSQEQNVPVVVQNQVTFHQLNQQFEKEKAETLRELEANLSAPLRAFTESQLAALYTNNELKMLESFVTDFVNAELKGTAIKQHPLYDLLVTYLQSRKNVKHTLKNIDELRGSCSELQKNLWTVQSVAQRKQGECDDGNTVYANCTFNKATFNHNNFKRLANDKNKIQELISQSHVFYTYMEQVTKLQIDCFIQNIINGVLTITHLDPNGDVILNMQNPPSHVQHFLSDLRLCISILFQFQRKVIIDPDFVKHARSWLEQLIAILLRLATWQDHLFILNHVLRCPPGIASWAIQFVQAPMNSKVDSPFANYEINHVISLLATILLPIEKREQFLEELQLTQQPDVVEALWVVVDSDGEDDDENAGTSLKENDLVSLLNQLPLQKLFRIVLHYDQRKVEGALTQNHILQLFSFSTVILQILQKGLATYNQARYLQLCKRLSRFVRHIVQYATDQLEIFFSSSEARYSTILDRLQVEYDALFVRAFYYLYVSEKLGAWQFLAVLPFGAITNLTLWKIFYFLHDFDSTTNSMLESTECFDYQSKLWNQSFRASFEDTLSNMAEDESYYLLSTIANMAMSRKESEMDFVKCAVIDLLHIGFASEATQDTCSKNTRIQLTHITSKYPQLLSEIFKYVSENMPKIGSLALYLYEELPISVWKISNEDLACIETWLMQKGATSNESKLSRMIISRLNWDIAENGELFLPYEFHCNIAELIVKAVEIEPNYLNWAWQTAVRLRLHISDKGLKSFDKVRDVEFYSTIAKGVRDQQPLAAFLSVLISSWGHLIPLICTKGFDQMLFLQLHQKHEAVLFALNMIVPLFLNCQENVINLDRFQMVLVGLLNADRTYINMAKSLVVSQNTILEQFGNMIYSQIASYKLYDLETPRYVVRLWIDSLVSVTNWNRDTSVMYLLDVIIQASFFHADCMDVIRGTLRDLLQASTPQEQSNSLTSLFKWASASSSSQNLLINTSLSSYPYLAVVIIDLEHEEREKSNNLWAEILQQLHLQKGKVNVDLAIKKSCSKLKVPSFASGSLCIFRWAQQALDCPIDHPIAVLFWQKFFILYLYHVSITPNQTVCVGEKFFDGMINFNFLKKMKRKLQEAVDYYKGKTTDADFKHLESAMQLYYMSAFKVFNAFSLWLEETRLQESSLYVPGIPPQYEPQLLNIILQGNLSLWLEYVNYSAIKETQAACIKVWNQVNFREKKNINQPLKTSASTEGKDPWQRIQQRLQSYDQPKGPPSVKLNDQLIPQLDVSDKKTLTRVIETQLEQLTNCAHNFFVESSTHTSMNRQYEGLIVKLYVSTSKTFVQTKCCTKTANNVHCSGPAKITYSIVESKINDAIVCRLDDFNAEYETFLNSRLQAAPVVLCYSSVLLQHVISLLENQKIVKRVSNAHGVELFYHILSLINEETSSYYPTKKLFTECLERLGQSHIHGEEEETPKLLDRILQDPNMGTYLAPHFSPVHVGTANFLMMYSMITRGLRQNYDLLYSLLSKFDVNKWLQRNTPKLSQRSQFIELVVKVLVEMGPEPSSEARPLHELFRKHLVAVFQYQFPEHYGEILIHILKASTGAVSDCIAVDVWLDILSVLAHPKQMTLNSHIRDQLRHYAQHQVVLNYQVLMETTLMLSRHYTNERLQYGLYGLYPKTINYVEVISLFLGMTGHSFIVSALNTHQGVLGEKVCEIIWPYLRDMFAPWILPYWTNNIKEDMATWIQQLTDDRAVILPWIPANTPYAQKMMNMFAECILFIIQTLPASNNIMSFLWQWYVTSYAHPAIKDHIFNVVHQALIPLPWQKFWPSVQDVELMLKVAEQYLSESHTFLGHVFMEISWQSWIANLSANATQPIKARIYHCFFNLLIKLCNEPNVCRNASNKAMNLLNQAAHFDWSCLEAQAVQQTMDWYIMSCDPTVILKGESEKLNSQVLTFIRIVCYYDRPYEGNDVAILTKRLIFVKTYVKLVTVFTNKHKSLVKNKEKIGEIITRILGTQLEHMEYIIRGEQEMNVLLGELLVLLNQSCIRDVSLKFFTQWLSTKDGDSMIIRAILQSAGNYVSDVESVAILYEVAIDTYFTKNVNDLGNVSWKIVAADLKPHKPKYSSLVSVLIQNGYLLTLHALLIEKIQKCDDKASLLNLCLTWFNNIKVNETNEHKLPLIWYDFLCIISQHLYTNETASGEFLYKFSHYLMQLSDQKEAAKWGGLLGAIGIGRQTCDNAQFKFICRALSGYVMSQLPEAKGNPQTIRNEAGAPCVVGQPGGNAEVPKILLKMDFGQNQGKIKEQAEKVLKQIQDPQNSFHNVNSFLRSLLLVSYTKPYLKEI